MAEPTRPLTKEQAPDPAVHFDRSDPKRESGAGRLTNNANATPVKTPDKIEQAVHNAQDGGKQLNGENEVEIVPKDRAAADKEPLGWEKKPKV